MEKILGRTAKDKISGFEGVITARCEYLYGVPRIQLTGKSVDSKEPMGYWVDEPQLEFTD